MINHPKVFIIVLNWNNFEDTIKCLSSLKRISYANYQIILVDNCSLDNSVEKVKEWCERKAIRYIEYDKITAEKGGQRNKENIIKDVTPKSKLIIIQTGKNLGFAGGNNVGIKYCLKNNTDYILLLNNDTLVDKRFLEPLVEFLENNENVGIVGANLFDRNLKPTKTFGSFPSVSKFILSIFGLVKERDFHARQFHNKPYSVHYPSGACFMLKKFLIDLAGLMSEDYFLYADEKDWAYRIRKVGFESYIIPESKVIHLGGMSTAKLPLEEKERINLKSQYNFMKKYYGTIFSLISFFLILVLHLSRFTIYVLIYPVATCTKSREKIKFKMKLHFVNLHIIFRLSFIN